MVHDVLNFELDGAAVSSILICALDGKEFVLSISNNTVNVSSLAPGLYVLSASQNGKVVRAKFIKE
ncbi:MAG: T9SS type A sorting domain-containing protein [Flavobacteriales bacterium]|nr:T9SS type A sorting domain-containing protein [Flavobacteriales bacterium]